MVLCVFRSFCSFLCERVCVHFVYPSDIPSCFLVGSVLTMRHSNSNENENDEKTRSKQLIRKEDGHEKHVTPRHSHRRAEWQIVSKYFANIPC